MFVSDNLQRSCKLYLKFCLYYHKIFCVVVFPYKFIRQWLCIKPITATWQRTLDGSCGWLELSFTHCGICCVKKVWIESIDTILLLPSRWSAGAAWGHTATGKQDTWGFSWAQPRQRERSMAAHSTFPTAWLLHWVSFLHSPQVRVAQPCNIQG